MRRRGSSSSVAPVGLARALLLVLAACTGCGGLAQTSEDSGAHAIGPSAGDATIEEEALYENARTEDATVSTDDGSAIQGLDSAGYASDAGRCGTGIVTFQLDPGPGGPWLYSTSGDEEPNWLALVSDSGTPLYRSPSEFTGPCGSCSHWGVPIGLVTGLLLDSGTTESWDGLYYGTVIPEQCPGSPPQASSCQVRACAPPGRYIAFMCACVFTDASPADHTFNHSVPGLPSSYVDFVGDCVEPTCVRIPFDYPSPTVVVGTVAQPVH